MLLNSCREGGFRYEDIYINENGDLKDAHRYVLKVPASGGEMEIGVVSYGLWELVHSSGDEFVTVDKIPYPPLEEDRYDLPNNERQRLVLYFSRNCVDWCFAGLVDQGYSQKQSRHYASMAISGENLIILSRSGDQDSFNAHCTNMITVHKIHDFRNLIY